MSRQKVKAYDPIRIQCDLVRTMAGTTPKSRESWLHYKYGIYDGDIWIFPNDYMAYVIPITQFYLDIDKVFAGKRPVNLKHLVRESQEARGAYFEKTTYFVKDEGSLEKMPMEVYRPIESGSSTKQWIDQRFMKGFNAPGCRYRMIDSISPLFIYDDTTCQLIGVVLPIWHKEEDDGKHHSDV